jgi:hypothetical protein
MPFGAVANHITNSITQNLRFPGHYYDSETSLDHNGARDTGVPCGRKRETFRFSLRNLFRFQTRHRFFPYGPALGFPDPMMFDRLPVLVRLESVLSSVTLWITCSKPLAAFAYFHTPVCETPNSGM